MKQFRFSLQKILEYKSHIQAGEMNILAVLQAEHSRLVSRKVRLMSEYEAYKEEYLQKCGEGLPAHELTFLGSYLREMQEMLLLLEIEIQTALEKVEEQRQRLIEITQEKTTLEKLREHHYEEYKRQERKMDERFIEELVAGRSEQS